MRLNLPLLTLTLFALLAVNNSGTAKAATLDFEFTFANTNNGSGSGIVNGIVRGLLDDATSAATSVEVFSNSDGYGVGEYVGAPAFNTFTVVGGQITEAIFQANGIDNTAPAVTDSTLRLQSAFFGSTFFYSAGLSNRTFGAAIFNSTETFYAPVSTIPVPAGGFLLFSGFIGLAALRRRRVAAN